MLNALEFWTMRYDNNWQQCDILFAYVGDNVLVPIERIDMGLLNEVAQVVPLYSDTCVDMKPQTKSKRGCKEKIEKCLDVQLDSICVDMDMGVNKTSVKKGCKKKTVPSPEMQVDPTVEKNKTSVKRGHKKKTVPPPEMQVDHTVDMGDTAVMKMSVKRGRKKKVPQQEIQVDSVDIGNKT